VWLYLLRQVFGPTRNWEANRIKVAQRKQLLRAEQPPKPPKAKKPRVRKVKPPKPKPQRTIYVHAYRTILADSNWPYRLTDSGACVPVSEDNGVVE